jgi:transcription initiation factor IIE alpha subunit
LFLSWSRMSNDFTLYQLFGQLIAIQDGIRELTTYQSSKNTQSVELLNFLYYGIQAQKKRIDTVSIYLPAMLEQNDRKLLLSVGRTVEEKAYIQLRQQLMGIAAQMKRSLTEVESALSAISFAIIPSVGMDDFNSQRGIKRYATTAGLGVVGMLIYPPLLIAGGFMALSTWLSQGDVKVQERIKQENEQYKLDFYLNKALDSYEHMMAVMYPYYVAECNRAMYTFYQQVANSFNPVITEPTTRRELFERMGQYYTFKQLPIDDSVTMKRQELIEKVHATLNIGSQNIALIQQETNYKVPQSNAILQLDSI